MQLLEPLKGSQSRPGVIAAELKVSKFQLLNLNQKFLSAITHTPAKSPHPLTLWPSRNPNHKPRLEPQNHPGSFLGGRRVNPLPELEAALCEQEGVFYPAEVLLFKKLFTGKKKEGGEKSTIIFCEREKRW